MEKNESLPVVQGGMEVALNQEIIQKMRIEFDLLKQFTKDVLEEKKDYGHIPGVDKPSLFQSGAISLKIAYGLAEDPPILERVIQDLSKNPPYVEYIVRQDIRSKRTGQVVASALASCNSYEEKYHYRWVPVWKLTPEQKELKDVKVSIKRKDKNGNWYVSYRFENDDIFSQLNTILQMAEKRAFVRAIRQAVPGASKLYTQDVEDMKKGDDGEDGDEPPTMTKEQYVAEINQLIEELGITADGMKELAIQNKWRGNNTFDGLKQRYDYLDYRFKQSKMNPVPNDSGSGDKTAQDAPGRDETVGTWKKDTLQPEKVPPIPPNQIPKLREKKITNLQGDELLRLCAQWKVDIKKLTDNFKKDSVYDLFDDQLKDAHNFIALESTKK